MLKFNTFRAQRYLRSRFVEGRFLLASEASDIELEILDILRKTVQSTLGDVAIADAWEVSRLSDTEILVKPGEAWFKGLPFRMRSGKDQLVSGTILTAGIVPAGVSISDDATGLGKIIEFNDGATTPTGVYRIVLTVREEVIDNVQDPFIKNANISETTALKVRLNIRINVVLASDQTESPVPYTNDTSDENLVNQIMVTGGAGVNGELIQTNVITGSEEIDGRDRELIIRNDPGIGGGNPFPNGTSDQQAFFNGKLIDSLGNEFHVNAVFNDTISTRVVIRIDKEVGQPDPQIINGSPYRLIKRDVYATDDINGSPQGKLFWTIGEANWHSANFFNHPSKITDLRESVKDSFDFQDAVAKRFNVQVTEGGLVSWDSSTSELSWSSPIRLINPHTGTFNEIAISTMVMVEDGTLAYKQTLDATNTISLGTLAVTVNSNLSNVATLAAVSLANVRVGNVVRRGSEITYITAIDDATNQITLAVGFTTTGAATIYLDSFGPGYAPLDLETFILAVRKNNKVYVAGGELESGETTNIGDGFSNDILTFIGSTGETDNSPNYTSVNYISDGQSLVAAISALDAAVFAGAGDTAALTQRSNEDRNLKLVAGGNWLWTLGTETLSWSANAFINFPAFQNDRNQISAGSIVLLANEVAYVDLNRTTDSPTVLPVSKVDIDSFVATNNRVIIARRIASDVIVGSHSFRLIDGQSKELDAGLSIQTRTLLGTGVTEATSAPTYSTRGAAQRIITNSQGILDALASADAEVDKFFGQLQIKPHGTLNKAILTGADRTMLDTAMISQELNDFLMSFTGAVINFQTGAVLKDDDLTALGANFTPFSIPSGEYFWYGIAAIAAAVTADNRQEIQLQITPASAANAVQANAPFPLIVGDKKIGAIQVRNNAGSIEVVAIRRLGVGSGSGAGTGDASGPEVIMTNRLLDSDMELLTPIIANSHKDTRLDPASVVKFDAGSKTYKFASPGLAVTSAQLLDSSEFLDEGLGLENVELLVFWKLGFIDTGATYQLSRNGGNEYQTITMERVGDSTGLYRGRLDFATEGANQLLQSKSLASDNANLVLNATTQQKVGQRFTVASTQIVRNVDIEINKTGTPTGHYRLALYSNNAGSPGTLLSLSGPLTVSSLSAGVNSIAVPMPATVLTGGNDYHLVLETTQEYKNSFVAATHEIAVRVDSAGTPVSQIYNGTAWSSGTGQWVYEVEGIVLDLRIKVTSSMSDVRIEAMGVLYSQLSSGIATGVKNRQAFVFSGDLNTTDFLITNFVPEPDLLRVYDVNTGLTYRYGAFSIDGQTIKFESGQFLAPGELISLVFDQTYGGSFDNSDQNALLLASNHLGSTDATIDKSVAGRGIFLRRPDGTLRELTIDNNDNIAIFSV